MLFECDLTVLIHLFIPGQSVTVRGECGDDIVLAVAVYIIGIHLGATMTGSEWELVKFPNKIVGERGRLFPPTARFEEVHAAITIDVPYSQAVREALPVSFL